MRAVVQRVMEASVKIDGKVFSSIGSGMMILICVEQGDTADEMLWLCKKLAGLRIFDDENGVMNLDIRAAGGEILAISQFTLVASTKKGNRPGYTRAAVPDEAVPLYEAFCEELTRLCGTQTQRGRFGADMKVSLINDGPVTIIIDTRLRE